MVWVVVPVHNRRRYTQRFLECLHRQTYRHLRIVIFDDGSSDGTGELVRSRFPRVALLHGDGNVWWTASVNRAVRRALEEAQDTDYVLVMNDDLEVDEDFVGRLLEFAHRHPRALVGAVVVDILNPSLIDFGGVRINWWTARAEYLNRGRLLSDFPPGYAECSSYLTGRATLIPVTVFKSVGLYDERHFLNCADTELPVRAAKRGWQLYVCYDAPVKSHIEALAEENRRTGYELGMARSYFFGVKSYARLQYRVSFARTGAGPNPIRMLTYISSDILRITAHFLRGLRRRSPVALG